MDETLTSEPFTSAWLFACALSKGEIVMSVMLSFNRSLCAFSTIVGFKTGLLLYGAITWAMLPTRHELTPCNKIANKRKNVGGVSVCNIAERLVPGICEDNQCFAPIKMIDRSRMK